MVPSSNKVDAYKMEKCHFDMSSGPEEDKKNEEEKDCFYNKAKDTRITLKFHESEDYKKYLAQKEQQE